MISLTEKAAHVLRGTLRQVGEAWTEATLPTTPVTEAPPSQDMFITDDSALRCWVEYERQEAAGDAVVLPKPRTAVAIVKAEDGSVLMEGGFFTVLVAIHGKRFPQGWKGVSAYDNKRGKANSMRAYVQRYLRGEPALIAKAIEVMETATKTYLQIADTREAQVEKMMESQADAIAQIAARYTAMKLAGEE